MIEWKWSKGENIEKSKRQVNSLAKEDVLNNIESTAYSASLHHDENTWEWMSQLSNTSSNDFNKREDTDKKMAERQMFSQISLNPYLTNNNYVNDIVISNSFLKPVSTTLEKEKIENENENEK
jgi:hypothetical protein